MEVFLWRAWVNIALEDMGKWPQAATCNQLTDCAASTQQDRKPGSGRAPVGMPPQAGEQASGWGWGLRRGFPWSGDIENEVMRVCVKDSWQPPALRIANFRGCGGISEITGTKLKVRSRLLSVSGERSPPELTRSLRMANCVTMHKLFHLLPRH